MHDGITIHNNMLEIISNKKSRQVISVIYYVILQVLLYCDANVMTMMVIIRQGNILITPS